MIKAIPQESAPAMSTGEAVQALILAESNYRDLELKLRHEAWRDGYRAGRTELEGAYIRGYTDAVADLKAIQHGIVRNLQLELRRWDGPRENFGAPRPADRHPHRPAGAA